MHEPEVQRGDQLTLFEADYSILKEDLCYIKRCTTHHDLTLSWQLDDTEAKKRCQVFIQRSIPFWGIKFVSIFVSSADERSIDLKTISNPSDGAQLQDNEADYKVEDCPLVGSEFQVYLSGGMQSYSKATILAIALILQLCCLFALTLSQSTDPVNMSMSTLGGFQSADHSLMVYRQFENLQTRVLLYKQDTLFGLERELEHFDDSNLFTTQGKEIDKTHLLKRIEQEWTAYGSSTRHLLGLR